jgi:AraC family transcriptional regulator of adaptative response/methylated-DNA-[protein]-cysteine methyltransferase
MNDYERVAGVIRHLDEHHAEQPGLTDLAACIGLSPFHFHRLFSAWAGVTPKDFLQCLTAEHAKRSLRNGEGTLGAALNAGMSGPGRLHDLCVTLEGASPGEIKSGGARWTIDAGFSPSPFGQCLVAQGPRGICHLSFVEPGNENNDWGYLQSEWPNARLRRSDATARDIVRTVFETEPGSRRHPALRAFVKGTPFQIRVWRALLKVSPGHLTTYSQLAASIGKPNASRAVGGAAGQNPLAYLIPCHRVIRATGVVGDYRWGTIRKRALLAWETAARSSRA